jgi:hypothetical protein
MLKMFSTCMDTSEQRMPHPLKGTWEVVNGLISIKKCTGEESLRYLLELNALRFLSVPTNKI